MRRRAFIVVLGGAVTIPFASDAKQSGKVFRVGYLAPRGVLPRDEAFRQRLRELGYVEGKNIIIEYRLAEGKFDRLPALAEELVRLDVDAIIAVVTQASLAAKQATRRIPIVMAAVSDPVGTGLVASLARPGGNVTGTSGMNWEVVGKSFELLKETVPAVSRFAVVWNPDNAVFQSQMLRETQRAADRLGVELRIFAARNLDEFEPAFAGVTGAQAGGLLVLPDPAYTPHAERIAALAAERSVPVMYGVRDHPAAGGLMSYGTNFADLFRRAADYVDRILKGAKPAELPVEQPTKFEFVINLKAANALGMDIPATLVARADEVIE